MLQSSCRTICKESLGAHHSVWFSLKDAKFCYFHTQESLFLDTVSLGEHFYFYIGIKWCNMPTMFLTLSVDIKGVKNKTDIGIEIGIAQPCYRWEDCGSESWSNLPKATGILGKEFRSYTWVQTRTHLCLALSFVLYSWRFLLPQRPTLGDAPVTSLLLFLVLIYWFLLRITVLDYTNLWKWTSWDKVTISVLEDSDLSQFVWFFIIKISIESINI